MTIFGTDLPAGWTWQRVDAGYTVRKRPKGHIIAADAIIDFAPMGAIPAGGDHAVSFERRRWADVRSGCYLGSGDVLVSKITPSFENGKQGMANGLREAFGYGSTEIIPIHARTEGDVNWFLFFYLLHPEVREHLTQRMEGSTGRQRVPEDALLGLPIPRPPVAEQTHISRVLYRIKEAVQVESRLMLAAQDLKRASLERLFTRGLRGEPQKETEIGPIPESWDCEPLGNHLLLAQYGLSVKGNAVGHYPILRMNCQFDGQVVFRDLQFVDLDERTFGAFRLLKGDLLFNRTNSYELVGRTAIFRSDRDAVFASYLIRLTLDTNAWHPEFVNYYLNRESVQADLKRLASRGVSQANISASKLRTYMVPRPSLDEQREIASIVEAIDAKIDLHRRKRAVLDELFKTLLHKLMTGEVRVGDLDLGALPSGEEAAA